MAEAVHHVDAVLADPLRHLRPDAGTAHPILVDQHHVFAVAYPVQFGNGGMEPDLVLLHQLGQQRVIGGAPKGVHRRPAVQQAVVACAGLLVSSVFGHCIEPIIAQGAGRQFDLAAGGVEIGFDSFFEVKRKAVIQGDHPFFLHFRQTGADLLQLPVEVIFDVIPGKILIQSQAQSQFPGDPPARLGIPARLKCRGAQRHCGHPPGGSAQVVVAFQVRAFRQHHIGPAGDLRRHQIDRHQQVKILDRLEGLLRLGQGEHQVGAVDDPALDGAVAPQRGDGGVTDAAGQGQAGHGKLFREGLAPVAFWLGIGRIMVLGHFGAIRIEEPAPAPPTAEQGVEDRPGAHSLGVVAVPGNVTPGMDQGGRLMPGHLPGGLADQRRLDGGDGISPFRGILRHRGFQFI